MSDKKTIIITASQPLDFNNYRRLGVEELKSLGCRVLYLSYYFNYKIPSSKLKFYKEHDDFINFKRKIDFIRFIFSLKKKNFYFIDFFPPSLFSNFVNNILKFKGGKKIDIDTGWYPEKGNKFIRSFKKERFLINFKRLYNIFKIRLKYFYTSFFSVKPDLYFCAGSLSQKKQENKRTKYVEAFSLDYQNYLNIKNEIKNKNIVTYIDQSFDDNYAIQIEDDKFSINEEKHYEILNKFFSDLENKLNIKIIIASHYRRDFEKKNFFDNEVIYYKTGELIRDSKFVIAHNSTAIGYAILFKKPVVFVSNTELAKDKYLELDTYDFANFFNKPVIQLDNYNINQIQNFLNIDDKAYENYIELFIKSKNSKFKNFWRDFLSHL